MQNWTDTVVESMENLWFQFVDFLPVLTGALLVFVGVWIIGAVLGKTVASLAKKVRVDTVFEEAGVTKRVRDAGIKWEPSKFLGALVRWFFILVAFFAAVDILNLTQVSEFTRDVLVYVPNVIAAALILLVGGVLASFLEKTVKASVTATKIGPANVLGVVVRWAVWSFAIIAALMQLGIADEFARILLAGLVGMLALAGGLAFGLGGKGVARDLLENVRDDLKGKE